MIPNFSHSLNPCGGIVESNYGEESNAWDDGLPPSDDICGAAPSTRSTCGNIAVVRLARGGAARRPSEGIGGSPRCNTGRLCANVGQPSSLR
jgi:hypothetical protein